MFYSGFLFLFVIVLIIFLLCILLVPITLRIKLDNLRHDSNISLSLAVKLCGRMQIFSLQRILGAETGYKVLKIADRRVKLSKQDLHKAVTLLQRLHSAVAWHETEVMLRFSTGDPAATGIIAGILHGLGGVLSAKLRRTRHFRKKKPVILVYPSFFEKELKYHLAIELSSSLGRIFYSVLLLRPNKKEVPRWWQNSIPFRT